MIYLNEYKKSGLIGFLDNTKEEIEILENGFQKVTLSTKNSKTIMLFDKKERIVRTEYYQNGIQTSFSKRIYNEKTNNYYEGIKDKNYLLGHVQYYITEQGTEKEYCLTTDCYFEPKKGIQKGSDNIPLVKEFNEFLPELNKKLKEKKYC